MWWAGAAGMLMLPVSVAAQGGGVRGTDPNTPGLTTDTFERLLDSIASWLLGIGAVVVAIFLIWGGLTYVFAGGNAEKAEAAKTRIVNALIGAAVVFGAWLIINTISALITDNISRGTF